jgi:hypothetical protein
MNQKLFIINWDTDEIMGEFEDLSKAKKYCRSLGHKGKNKYFTSYEPIAFVGIWQEDLKTYAVVYNPCFKFED